MARSLRRDTKPPSERVRCVTRHESRWRNECEPHARREAKLLGVGEHRAQLLAREQCRSVGHLCRCRNARDLVHTCSRVVSRLWRD